MNGSTIAALATPAGRGGIGIIKISGAEAISIVAGIFRPAKASWGSSTQLRRRPGDIRSSFASHQLHYGHIVDFENNRVLDEVLVAVMRAPRSYTREDVVEINAHGGPIAVRAILNLVIKQGARLANPGEFTQRAFLNGRIDLSQAEAVIDIINAQTEKSLQIAAAQVDGRLRKNIEGIRSALTERLTQFEAAIDFPDDVGEIIDPEGVRASLEKAVVEPLRRLIANYREGRILREGLKLTIVGRPNVGKSSLLNQLVQKDRAIVTALPGTTRDIIEETINIQGIAVTLTDTAGLHESNDPIERIGIEKTLEHITKSGLVLFMVEAHHPLTADDHTIYEKVRSARLIIVINKIDLADNDFAEGIPANWKRHEQACISALYGLGIDRLKDMIGLRAFGQDAIALDDAIIPNVRHEAILRKTLEAANSVFREMQNGASCELAAIHLKEAINLLGEITGATAGVDVLEAIFSQFCIGK
ncbi:MAG: tRNA uridine-5-carboxymethylaminomethyl(34) synthesis GTPase MnmE [Desulfobacterales bacterium]|nr:MAG: tRNA uridine-5-carboxymethylaminomethyl(34) synthesis GTPase MnmE [Desulfobacterales bacterium]